MKSGKNYFVCYRSLFKCPFWYSEKFTKGQAWVDLFGNANHSDGWFEKNGQRVDVKRGQTGRSIDSLADDWKWSRNRVKRFLKRLENDHMIDHKTNHLTSIITICNYDKYQFGEKEDEPSNEPSNELPGELPGEPQTNKNKERIKKELNNKQELFTKAFEKWWLIYPKRNGRRIGKKAAKKKFLTFSQSDWSNLKIATKNYESSLLKSGLSPSDAHRFLNDTWKEYIEAADNAESLNNGNDRAQQQIEETRKFLHGE